MGQPKMVIPYDIEQAGEEVINFYLFLVAPESKGGKGQSPRMAEMLALQQAPRCMTDDVFLGGVGTLEKQLPNAQHREIVMKNAMKHGYKPKVTDYYLASVARFPGDPEAFVNHGQGLWYAKKLLERRGNGAEGAVTLQTREPEEDPYENPVHRLNPKIVKRKMKQIVEANPALALKDKRELTEAIVDKHGKKK